jgi:hypothetical protein
MSRQVPHAEDTATGTPTAGLVPISAGPGLAPAWGAAGGGGGSGAGPLCVVYLATGYDLANGSGARNDVAWDAEDTDTTGMHDLVTNPERLTIATAGWYDLRYQVEWAADGSNDKPRHAFLMLNGTHQLHHVDQDTQTDNSTTGQGGACLIHLNAGDYVTLQLEQESGFAQHVRGLDAYGSPTDPDRPTQMSVCMVGGPGGGGVGGGDFMLLGTYVVPVSGVDNQIVFGPGVVQDYKHLQLEGQGRSDAGGASVASLLRINGVSGAGAYRWVEQYTDFTTAFNYGQNDTSIYIGDVPGAGASAGSVGSFKIEIPNYTNTTFNRHVLVESVFGNALALTHIAGVTLSGVPMAVDSIQLLLGSSAHWDAGSMFSLYGKR